MACLRLLTFLPLRPLLRLPFLRFFIARSTYLEAPLEYLRAILLLLKQISRRPLQMRATNAGNGHEWNIVPEVRS